MALRVSKTLPEDYAMYFPKKIIFHPDRGCYYSLR
jgi:hypothetical protein